MKVYTSYQSFEEEFLVSENNLGFKTWTVTWVYQLEEQDLPSLPSQYKDTKSLPFIITLAEPLHKKTVTVALIDSSLTLKLLYQRSQKHFIDDASRRVKGLQPEKMKGFYEYDNWKDFKDDWLVRDDKLLIPYIYPLAFDIPEEIEYIDWIKLGRTEISYRRLVVTVYLHKKNVFHDLFIKGATKEDVDQYLMHVKAQIAMEGARS